MTALAGRDIALTMGNLLQIDNNNSGVDGTLRNIEDGEGTQSSLQISTAQVKATGTFAAAGAATFATTLGVTGAVTLASSLSVGGTLGVTGTTTVQNLTVNGTLAFSGTTTFANAVTFSSTVALNGATTLGATLTATGQTITGGALENGTLGNTTPYTIAKIDNIRLDGNTIDITASNGNITIAGNGTGKVILGQASCSGVQLFVDQPILDGNGNPYFKFVKAASAVNQLTITNQATTGSPSIVATGTDTNIGVVVGGTGTGFVGLGQATSSGVQLLGDQPLLDSAGNKYVSFAKTASAVNGFTITNAATGTSPVFSATGTDLNLDISFQTKALGGVNILGNSSTPGFIRYYENTGNGTNFSAITAPTALAANRTVTLPDMDISNWVVQRVSTMFNASTTGSTVIPIDDTIPQQTEGDQYMTQVITPKSATSVLQIDVVINLTTNQASGTLAAALFQDSSTNAVAASWIAVPGSTLATQIIFRHIMTSGTTSATTFKVRAGLGAAGTTTFNGSASNRFFGGVMASSLSITEYAA